MANKLKKHTRKAPCELCGASCGSNHKVTCWWAYNSRQEKHPSFLDKAKAIMKIIKA